MTIKLEFLFVACIVFALALARPDMVDTGLDPVEETKLAVKNDTDLVGREKREFCGWKFGCHKGYCWANCKGGFGVLGK